MKKLFTVLVLSVLLFSCSAEESSETIGNLNISEVFRGDWITPDEEYTAKVAQTYLEVHGVRTITSVTSERKKQGLYESREGEKSSSNKLTECQILEIYKLIRQFYSNSEILDMLALDIGLTGLNQIRHGKSWKYLWEQEGMIVIPSLKKEKGGLSSPNKIKVLTDIENGTSVEDIKQKYQLQTTDIKRIKEKTLWKPVWDIYNNYYKIN